MKLVNNRWYSRPLDRQFWLRLVLMVSIVLVVIGLVGCGGQSGEGGDPNLQVTLIPAPEGVAGQTLTVQLADAAGQPITDARVSLEGNMNHAGMVPVIIDPVPDNADGAIDGRYVVPFAFTMLGDWIITVSIQQANGATVQQNIDVNVGEAGVTIR